MMPLFNMPSPDEIRLNARRSAMEQGRLFAQLPPGRGLVQTASTAGGLFGQAIGEAAGGKLPGQEQAEKFKAVQQSVMKEITDNDIDISQPEGFYTMANLTAQRAVEAGLPEVAQQAQLQALEIRKQFMPSSGQQINIDAKSESEYDKVLAKKFGEAIDDKDSAIQSISAAETMLGLLEDPMFTGSLANAQLAIGNFMKKTGAWDDDKGLVANTQAYIATSGKQTGQVIKAFGSGTGLSDADREYANKIAGGSITMDANALKEINRLNIVASVNKISEYNKKLDQANLPPERKAQLYQRVPDKYQAIADEYNATYGKVNKASVKARKKAKAPAKNEVLRQVNGRAAIFDARTKKFIRWND